MKKKASANTQEDGLTSSCVSNLIPFVFAIYFACGIFSHFLEICSPLLTALIQSDYPRKRLSQSSNIIECILLPFPHFNNITCCISMACY